MITKQKIGVVLAGGRSTRMGRDKALLNWRGVSLIDHVCRVLREAGVDRVVVSGERPGYDCLPDLEPDRGPGFAVSGVLAALPESASALVVPVDMPLLTAGLLQRLLAFPAASFLGYPLPCVLPTRAPGGGALQGDSVKALLRAAGYVALPVAPEEETLLVNTNTPEDWQGIQPGEPA